MTASSISRLADLSEAEVNDIYDRLLRRAFRPEELLDLDELVETYTAADPPPHGVLLTAGRPVAVLLSEWYVERRVLLLSYLAVAEESRGQGAGSVLADHLADWLQAAGAQPITVAEVDDPRAWPGDSATGDAEARLRFYERRGARLVPVGYFQPSLSGPGHRVPGMFLIRLDTVPETHAGLLQQFLVEYFSVCEGPGALQDPSVVGLLREVEALGDLGHLPPLSEWRTTPTP